MYKKLFNDPPFVTTESKVEAFACANLPLKNDSPSLNYWLMRISIVAYLLVFASIHLSATSMAQKVTLHRENITLKDMFVAINKQTGYHFIWSSKVVPSNSKIKVNAENMP